MCRDSSYLRHYLGAFDAKGINLVSELLAFLDVFSPIPACGLHPFVVSKPSRRLIAIRYILIAGGHHQMKGDGRTLREWGSPQYSFGKLSISS